MIFPDSAKNKANFYFLFFSIFLFPFPSIGQSQLSSGTKIPVRITELIHSETDTSALIVKQAHGVVAQDVTGTDGRVLIHANTPVELTAALQRTRGRGRAGSVLITPISTTSTDGQTITLTGEYSREGKSFKGVTYLVAGGAFVASVIVGALLISSGTSDDIQDENDGHGKRLAGGILLGLSPLNFLWLLRHGQAVEVKPGFVLEDVRVEGNYEVR